MSRVEKVQVILRQSKRMGRKMSTLKSLSQARDSITLIIRATSGMRVVTENATTLAWPQRRGVIALHCSEQGFMLCLNSITLVVGSTASIGVVTKDTAALAESLCILLVCLAEESFMLSLNSFSLIIRTTSVDVAIDTASLSEGRGLE